MSLITEWAVHENVFLKRLVAMRPKWKLIQRQRAQHFDVQHPLHTFSTTDDHHTH